MFRFLHVAEIKENRVPSLSMPRVECRLSGSVILIGIPTNAFRRLPEAATTIFTTHVSKQ